ncbi:MAG: PAS domain S-box protein, partial [bacterium]
MPTEKLAVENLKTGHKEKHVSETGEGKSGNPTLIADNKGRIIHFNPAFREFTGYSSEEIEGKHLLEVLLSAGEAELTEKKFMGALENGETLEIVREYQISADEHRQLRFHVMAIPGFENEAGKIVCVGTEIPEDVSTLKIYFETAMDGTIIDISPSVEKISGYKREGLIGTEFKVSYYNPSDRLALVDQLLKTGSVSNFETIINDKNDNKHVCAITASLVRTKDGSPLKIVGNLNIIENNHKFIDALLESERKYHELANSLPEVIFEIDHNGFLTFINENAFVMFGYTKDDLTKGLHVLQTLAEKDRDRAKENIQKAFITGKVDDA